MRPVALLALCQAVFQAGSIHLTTSGALISLALTSDEAVSTWPSSLAVLSALAMTMPASFLMARYGRRFGFFTALAAGSIGASVMVAGMVLQKFPLFLGGAACLGVLFSFTNYLRFAAVEIVPANQRAKAISLVLVGGVFAAFIGPSLTRLGAPLIFDHPFAGGYLLLLPLYLMAVLTLLQVRFPGSAVVRRPVRESLRVLLSDAGFYRIVFLGAGAYVMMVLLMTATPLAMHHHHLGFEATTDVIRAHVLGMFVPSFFTGHLIARWGARTVISVGALCFAGCIGVNFSGHSYWHFLSALVLLGVGWNFLFVSASQMLTATIVAEHQSSAQALNEFIVSAGAAAAISMTGKLHQLLGWQNLNLLALPLVLLLFWAGFSRSADSTAGS
ncbi:MAG: MFS transporter [Turneriella sp.]